MRPRRLRRGRAGFRAPDAPALCRGPPDALQKGPGPTGWAYGSDGRRKQLIVVASASKIFNLENALFASDQAHRQQIKILEARLRASSVVVRIPIGQKGSLPPTALPNVKAVTANGTSETGPNGTCYFSRNFSIGRATWILLVEYPADAAERVSLFLQLVTAAALAKVGFGSPYDSSPTLTLDNCIFGADGVGLGFPKFATSEGILDPGAGFREEHGDCTYLAFRVWVHVWDALDKKDGGPVPKSRVLENGPDWPAPF